MTLPDFDIVQELAGAWADENRENLEYHLHPDGEEGMSDKGHCSWQLAWRASGRPIPKKEGERAFTGAMDVGRMHHAEAQRKLVPRLKKKYPGYHIGPIIGPNGEPEEVYVWVKMFEGCVAYSPLDLCVATAPGFVKVWHQFKNGKLEVWELAPGAKIEKAWDIKSANAGSFYYKQKEEMAYDHEAQFMGYMAAAKIPQLPALYVNKDDGRSFVKICQWDKEKWDALITKRMREKALAEQLRDPTAKPKVVESDFYWYNPEMKGLCLYCAHAKVREQLTQRGQSYAKPKFELVGPCVDALRAENQTLDDILPIPKPVGMPHRVTLASKTDAVRVEGSPRTEVPEVTSPPVILPILNPDPEPEQVKAILLPPDFTDDELLENINETLTRKCIWKDPKTKQVCGQTCDGKSKYFCANHGPKIKDTVGL